MHSATVRALGESWVLTLEKKSFLRRIHEDPSLVFGILEKMSRRIRELDHTLVGFAQSVYEDEAASARVPSYPDSTR